MSKSLARWDVDQSWRASEVDAGPMIAAFIVLAVVEGWGGVAGLWKQMTRWRVEWKWWLLAPGVLIAVQVCALMINVALWAP